MTVELTLQPVVGFSTIYPTRYEVNGETRILVDDYTVYKRVGQLKKNEIEPKEKMIHFEKRAAPIRIKYETDKNGEPLPGRDQGIYNTIEEFYKFHPYTSVNGKVHANSAKGCDPMFNLEDIRVKSVESLEKWDKKVQVATYVRKADLTDLREISYYIGENPRNMIRSELLIHLADFEKGSIFARDKTKEVIDSFINDLTGGRELKINARKAITLGVFVTQVKDGVDAYYLSGDFIGSDFETVVDWIKRNDSIYRSFIIPQILLKDKFTDEEGLGKHESKDIRDVSGAPEEAEMRNKIKELIADLDAAGIEHGVKANNYLMAKNEKLKAVYDKLVALKVPA